MPNQVHFVANVLGGLGLLLCLVAGLVRLFGMYYLGGFELLTLFDAGIALMVAACFLKLHGIAESLRFRPQLMTPPLEPRPELPGLRE